MMFVILKTWQDHSLCQSSQPCLDPLIPQTSHLPPTTPHHLDEWLPLLEQCRLVRCLPCSNKMRSEKNTGEQVEIGEHWSEANISRSMNPSSTWFWGLVFCLVWIFLLDFCVFFPCDLNWTIQTQILGTTGHKTRQYWPVGLMHNGSSRCCERRHYSTELLANTMCSHLTQLELMNDSMWLPGGHATLQEWLNVDVWAVIEKGGPGGQIMARR